MLQQLPETGIGGVAQYPFFFYRLLFEDCIHENFWRTNQGLWGPKNRFSHVSSPSSNAQAVWPHFFLVGEDQPLVLLVLKMAE
jgi:hypothetical protein